MGLSNQQKNKHLMWRAGFGPMAEDLGSLVSGSTAAYTDALWRASSRPVVYIDRVDNALKGLMAGVDEAAAMQRKELSPDEKKQMRRQSQQDIKSLNLAWLDEMVNSDAQLREKMALFWHGHFASRNLNIYYQQQLLDTIRRGALGNFGDLLRNVSKSAAMLNFLNNNQNKKGHPNENFAREVMELFTMGRGNYSEEDVKEAARAFTGWRASLGGDFVFRREQHDGGQKTVLGRNGHFDGDDVLDILLEQRQTAVFITRKIYRYLVNDTVDDQRIAWLATRWYDRHYDIKSLLEDIFRSEWFYDADNIGCRIKSPVDLLVGIRRLLPMQIDHEGVQLLVQRLLGQLLFYPPNVAGWPGGTNWIDSSTLMFRMQLPGLIFTADIIRLQPKSDDDQTMGMQEMNNEDLRPPALAQEYRRRKKGMAIEKGGAADVPRRRGGGGMDFVAKIDWTDYLKRFEGVRAEDLPREISAVVLQTPSPAGESLLKKYAGTGDREEFIRRATIRLMSTPEYQLC